MKTIVLTGVTGLIGRVLLRHFIEAGDFIIGISRSIEALDKIKNELGDASTRFHCLQADLSKESACSHINQRLLSANLWPDCLINNARDASYLRPSSSGLVSRKDFIGEFLMDVVVPYELTMAIAQHPNTQLKSVVNIGSQYGVVAPNLNLYLDPSKESPLHYGVSKAGLSHLTKELAVRLATKDIRVNCVAFGGVEGRVQDDFKKRYSILCPMGRMLNENDLAGPVDLLLSTESSAITGHTLIVDAGWSLW